MKCLVMAAMLFGAAPVLAQTPPSTQPDSPAADDRIICERIKETGSRLSTKKICMTKLQWDEKRRTDRQEMEDAQNRRTEPSGG